MPSTRPILLAYLRTFDDGLLCRSSKRRFSEFAGEASRNQEETGGLEQGLDNEPEPVVAQGETFVLQQPGVAALDRPAPPAQARAARPAALVQARLGPRRPAQPPGGGRGAPLFPRDRP